MHNAKLSISLLILIALLGLLVSCRGKDSKDDSSIQRSGLEEQKDSNQKKSTISPVYNPSPTSIVSASPAAEASRPTNDDSRPAKTDLEPVNIMNANIDKGYSYRSTLKMNIKVSFPGYSEDIPLTMTGYVSDSQEFSGVMEIDQNGRTERTEVVATEKLTYALYHGHAAWQKVPSVTKTINPPSLIDAVRKNLEGGALVDTDSGERSGKTHVRAGVSASVFGELIPLLRASSGTLTADIWINNESGYLARLRVAGNAKGGPTTKGPNGEELTIKFTADLSLSDFGENHRY